MDSNPYDKDTIPTLEAYVDKQLASGEGDIDANTALLKVSRCGCSGADPLVAVPVPPRSHKCVGGPKDPDTRHEINARERVPTLFVPRLTEGAFNSRRRNSCLFLSRVTQSMPNTV